MIFGLLALLGRYISDIMLSYIIIVSILLWPCVQYHSLLQKAYLKCEPVFMKLDYSMKNKSKWHYQTVSGNLTTANNNSDDGGGHMAGTVDPEAEMDLEEFMPSEDSQISAALARAITDSEDEGGSLTASTTPLTFSKEPSVLGDDDNEADLEDELIQGIDAMPSYSEVLDHTDDELLTPDLASQSKSRESSEELIRFESGHFDNSSGSEEDLTLAPVKGSKVIHSEPVEATETLAEALMANALKQMVGSAFQNLTGMTKQTRIKARPKRARIAYTHGDSGDTVAFDTVDAGFGDGAEARSKPRTRSVDSEEINIEEEFEFLDQYDLDEEKE